MSPLLADRLSAARRHQFVGRDEERALFTAVLRSVELPFLVLYICGPGGIGKTSLLQRFRELCVETGVAAFYLDARHVGPMPEALLAELRRAMDLRPEASPAEELGRNGARSAILIDTYETLTPLDTWLRDSFLPQLPETVLVVLASRDYPAAAWLSDPGWQTLMRIMPLRNLSSAEGTAYLQQRGVPANQCAAVLDFTHGHPLALSLVAEMFAQRRAVIFQPEAAPDIIKTLVEQFVQKVPGPAHRAALEACALVRLTSEPLLSETLGLPDVHEIFEWLRSLSFIESGPLGLFPHDLAREALAVDLRWRHPDWYRELHRRARAFYVNRIGAGRTDEERLLFDLVFLHRENPAVRPFFEWQHSGSLLADAAHDADRDILVAMVSSHEGPASARLAAHWLDRQPEAFLVFRDAGRQVKGFMALLSLERAGPADLEADPAAQAAGAYLQHHAGRPGERFTHFRFWMDAAAYQSVSPVQSLVFIQAVRHYLTTPGLAFTFFPVADANFWDTVLAYADLASVPEAGFEVGGRRYAVYGHDWRSVSPAAWLALLGEREIGAEAPPGPPARPAEQVVVLSPSDFMAAVRDALRNFLQPDFLRQNPLVRSRLVVERVKGAGGQAERVAALKALIHESADALQATPRDARLYRALYHTYFQPAPTQEAAAELLDLPLSTYRRHLLAGVRRVTEALWQREVGD